MSRRRNEVFGPASHPTIRDGGATRPLDFFAGFAPGAEVLDVGCGTGIHLRDLRARGVRSAGVEVDETRAAALRAEGFRVQVGTAEKLPFPDGTFDGIVCSVVLPYTDERLAVREWARVLRPGGVVRASFHGVGYALEYLSPGRGVKEQFYGARMLLNTVTYRVSGRRLPGWMGDTLVQTERRLGSYYEAYGLRLDGRHVIRGRHHAPRFIFHHLSKVAG